MDGRKRSICIAASYNKNLPMMRNLATASARILGLLGALACVSANAARPLNTDDANIVDEKSCQLESWVRSAHGVREFWAIPGCNFGHEIEWSLGGSKQKDDLAGDSRYALAQAKIRWKPVQPGSWGLATSIGAARTRNDLTGERFYDKYVNVPLTFALPSDRFMHLNLGWIHHGDAGKGRLTYGVGGEIPLGGPVIAVIEAYGERHTPTKYQAGLRFWIVPQRVQIDTTYGNSFQGPSSARWISVGLRLLSPAFLP